MGDTVMAAITQGLGHSDIAFLKMGVHIGSRCTAFRDAGCFLAERCILHQVGGRAIAIKDGLTLSGLDEGQSSPL
jgi:hypothetical protein